MTVVTNNLLDEIGRQMMVLNDKTDEMNSIVREVEARLQQIGCETEVEVLVKEGVALWLCYRKYSLPSYRVIVLDKSITVAKPFSECNRETKLFVFPKLNELLELILSRIKAKIEEVK